MKKCKQIDKYTLHFYDIEQFDDMDVVEANFNTRCQFFEKMKSDKR